MSEITGAAFQKAAAGKRRTDKHMGKSLAVCIPLGALCALIFGILLLALFTVIGLRMRDPDPITPPLALTALFLCALLGGYTAARLHGRSGLLCGAATALLFVAILVLLVFARGGAIKLSLFVICAPASIVLSAVAGVCAVSGRSEKRRKKRKF